MRLHIFSQPEQIDAHIRHRIKNFGGNDGDMMLIYRLHSGILYAEFYS